MTQKNDGGPAFPSHAADPEMSDPRNRISCGSMSLRDWFAGKAPITFTEAAMACGYLDTMQALMVDGQRGKVFKMLSDLRFEYADAMIAAREAKP